METTTPRTRTARLALAGVFAAAAAGLAGCGDGGEEPDAEDVIEGSVAESAATTEATTAAPTTDMPVAPAPANPYVGPYNQQFAEDTQLHEGQQVTLTGEVEEVVSANAMTIEDPDDAELGSLLVVHDLADLPELAEDQVIEVTGTLHASFDASKAGSEAGVELGELDLEDHVGEFWLHATEVTATQ